ncbi:MAG: porin family protein [Akkermansia sp.]|nr:porin family protein [Akkermansia sp.]
MKKCLSIITLLGALSGVASAAPYVLPSPQPGALTPYDWQPVYAIEGLYSIADSSDDPDMWGVRGSLNLYSSADSIARHQFNINVGYETGDESYTPDGDINIEVDAYKIPVTVGYDINLALTDSFMLYAGGKAGYAFGDIDVTVDSTTYGDNAGGFTFSVGGGIKIQCSDAIYVKAGYEFTRTYFGDCNFGGATQNVIMGHHVFSVGIGSQF